MKELIFDEHSILMPLNLLTKHYSTMQLKQLLLALAMIALCDALFCQSNLGAGEKNAQTSQEAGAISFEKWYHILGSATWNISIPLPIRRPLEIEKIEPISMTEEVRSQNHGNEILIEISKEQRKRKPCRNTGTCYSNWSGGTIFFVPPPPPPSQHHFRG